MCPLTFSLPSTHFTENPFANWTRGGSQATGFFTLDLDWRVPIASLRAELARLVRQWFPLPSAPCLRIRVGEARQELESGHAAWQAVVRDAFMNREVPGQLRTVESARRVHDVLEPGGLYALNTVASAGLRRIDEEFAALTSVFQDVVAIADPAVFSGRRFGNVVVAASDRRFDLPTVEREVRRLSLPARVMDRGAVACATVLGRRQAPAAE